MTDLKHTFINTNGIKLHVVQAGPEDGKLVVLLHGFPEFWYGWHNQINFLASQGYRVWAPDQRGYNFSDKPQGKTAYGLDILSDDLIGLIDAAGREKIVLIGHDWGAAVSWWTAMRYPERLEKLIIMNVPHPVVSAQTITKNWEQTRKSWYMFAMQIPWLPEKMLSSSQYRGLEKSFVEAARPDTFSADDLAEYRKAWSQPDALTSMMNWYRAVIQLRPKFPANKRITVPTRIIWGAQDVAIIRQAAQMSMEWVDNGDLIYMEEAGHFVQHEEPERVNALIGEFLKA